MNLSLESKNVDELKIMLKKYDLVSGITSLRKDDLIKTIRAVKNYKENKQIDYDSFNFNGKMIQLNEEQKAIVTADLNKNIRILSCAGSGKTTTIICRIKYLIDQGIDPERIMVTSFNVDAAESIKNKIIELFGFMPKVCVGTIDSIACRYYYRYFKQPYHVGVSEYANYFLKYLQTEGNLIGNLYHYVFFDEFQDVNEIQFKILKCFYDYGAYVTVIGDDAQCIYAFRGSNIKYILNLEQYLKNLTTYKMVNNYRSTPEVINFANQSISFNTEQIPKDMIPNKKSIDFLPTIKYYENIYIQNDDIIKTIFEFNIKKQIPFEEMAVLCRVNYPLKLLEEAIEKVNKKTDNQIKYVALINDDNSDIKPKMKPNHISLTTIHKSKGLEWKVVFLIDCEDSRFPSETDKLSVQEERRLFYVAITRAKEYLYLFFNGEKKNGKEKLAKLTRFIQEIDKDKYHFVNYDQRFYYYDDYRSVKWVNGVTETIKILNETDIAKIREYQILPETNPTIKKIHDKCEFNSYINTYYLQPDFGEFIDRYVTRTIGKRNPDSGGLIDNPTVIIISACQFTNQELIIYKKYETNFRINMGKININTPDWKYCSLLSENDLNLEFIKKIEKNDEKAIKSIIQKILLTAKKFNIDVSILAGCFSVKNEVPEKIKLKLIESYKKYNSPDYQSGTICNDIYNISLCGTILGGRRRLLYKDVFSKFRDGYDNLFDDIEKYVNDLNPEFTNLICKKMVKSDEYDLIGEIDLLDIDNHKIIDFKCSQSDKFKLEWILQLLAYAAMIKKHYDNIVINYIEVYNPLQGEIYTMDISNWDKADEYLSYLYEIRVRQVTRNIKIEDQDIEANFPISYDHENDNSFKLPDKITKKIETHRDDVDDDYLFIDSQITQEDLKEIKTDDIYNFKSIFGDNYKYFYNCINQQKDRFRKYSDIIQKIDQYNNKRYMVLDTETTGLPERPGFGTYYPYDKIDKYKDARMIQLCWAIYDDGELESIENYLIRPKGFKINNSFIHGITNKMAAKGNNINEVLTKFSQDLGKVKYIVAHNIKFDIHIICSELYRSKFYQTIELVNHKEMICTMEKSIPLKVDGVLKPPKLIKLYKFLFGKEFTGQHNAKYDVLATGEVFNELIKRNLIKI